MIGMAGYTKLFNSILGSSIWRTGMETKILWITLLAMADKDGIAEASVGGLADFARLSVEQTKKALAELSAPDEDSRTKEFEGRRIEAVDGGWRILNHAKYRAKMGADERREYKRLKEREYRAKKRGRVVDNDSTGGQTGHIAEAEAEADTKAKAKEQGTDSHISTALSTDEQIDDLRKDIETEEKALLRHLVALQAVGEDVQAVCDSLDRPKGQAAFNANRALLGGRSGIPETPVGLTVRRRLVDALEARQRAQAAPILSENNRKAFEAIDRVTARLKARRDGTPLPREIEG